MNTTDAQATTTSGTDSTRDKGRLGVLLVAASSVVTLAVIAVFAFQMMTSGDSMIAKDAESLGNFSTAAGSKD